MELVHNILVKRMGSSCRISPEVISDLGSGILEEEEKRLIENFVSSCKNKGLLLLTEPQVRSNPFHFGSYCTFNHRKRLYEIEDCIKEHPESVVSFGPVHIILVTAPTISKKWQKYYENAKESYAKRHFSKIVIERI